ncbi:hypothetical protein C7E25_23480, partial [Stenotrophomonas maltophilia]
MQTSYPLRRNGSATSVATCLSGIVVALALIPEAIAFSLIAGVDPMPVRAEFSHANVLSPAPQWLGNLRGDLPVRHR